MQEGSEAALEPKPREEYAVLFLNDANARLSKQLEMVLINPYHNAYTSSEIRRYLLDNLDILGSGHVRIAATSPRRRRTCPAQDPPRCDGVLLTRSMLLRVCLLRTPCQTSSSVSDRTLQAQTVRENLELTS